ncbi:MAG: hypothetical protein VB074_14335 [Proteiniphilum sp.]|uniref:hypothetical protein n=1 Tax=Proteiniphilum sp. TaxID=1926877 RepID=UPI002B221027|nr:hypothetical protein [Proteiniphilum sp.]MEA5129355.1 hypothetical protein [Proteiniphilum sp.]
MNLILTFDYELFGNGTGNVFTHMIKPMNTILGMCDACGIKTTLFFEALEYIRLKEEWNKGNCMGYTRNPIEAIEHQIQQAAVNGHDIQLHIHPQWYNATFKDGKWELDFTHWRLGGFRASHEYDVKKLISECKTELEKLIAPVVPDYKCIALRAGGYNIMPSDEVYKAMCQVDLKMDSSVYPGGYETGNLSNYDYRNVSDKLSQWRVSEVDFRKSSEVQKEILELPIFALPVSRWKRMLTVSKIKALLLRQNAAISSVAKEKVSNQSLPQKLKFMLGKESSTWDVCMFSKYLHKKYFCYIENHLSGKRDTFVLIGHPKSLRDEKLFNHFLEEAQSRKQQYSFTTLKAYYESIV